jgi:hypothetical protein
MLVWIVVRIWSDAAEGKISRALFKRSRAHSRFSAGSSRERWATAIAMCMSVRAASSGSAVRCNERS